MGRARVGSETLVLLGRWLGRKHGVVIGHLELEANRVLIQEFLDDGVGLILLSSLQIAVCLEHLLANVVVPFVKNNLHFFLFHSIHLILVVQVSSHLFVWTCRRTRVIPTDRAFQKGGIDVLGERLIRLSQLLFPVRIRTIFVKLTFALLDPEPT